MDVAQTILILTMAGMQRKGNPSALLVGVQTGTASVENSMEFPQKAKNGTAFWPSNSIAGITLRTLKHQFKRTYVHSSVIYNSQILEAT